MFATAIARLAGLCRMRRPRPRPAPDNLREIAASLRQLAAELQAPARQ